MPISGLALWHRSTCEHLAVEKWSYHSATVASDGWMGTRSHCSLNGFQSCSFSWDRRNPKNAFLMFSHFLMFSLSLSLSLSACTQGFLHYTCHLDPFGTLSYGSTGEGLQLQNADSSHESLKGKWTYRSKAMRQCITIVTSKQLGRTRVETDFDIFDWIDARDAWGAHACDQGAYLWYAPIRRAWQWRWRSEREWEI